MVSLKKLEIFKYAFVGLFFVTSFIQLWGNVATIFVVSGLVILYIGEVWVGRARGRMLYLQGQCDVATDIKDHLERRQQEKEKELKKKKKQMVADDLETKGSRRKRR